MSLVNGGINVSQLLALRDILDLLSNPDKKKALLSEAAEAFSKAQEQEAKAAQAIYDLSVIEARAAKGKMEAEELLVKANDEIVMAQAVKKDALAEMEEVKKLKSALLKDKSAADAWLKASQKDIDSKLAILAASQEACAQEKEAAQAILAEYKEKAEKLKKALGE